MPIDAAAMSPVFTPTVAIEAVTDTRIQATASLVVAAARITWPTLRCSMPISDRILAMIGIALTDRAAPRRSDSATVDEPSARILVGSRMPAPTPAARERRMLLSPRRSPAGFAYGRRRDRARPRPDRPTGPRPTGRWRRSAAVGACRRGTARAAAPARSHRGSTVPGRCPPRVRPSRPGSPRRRASHPNAIAAPSNTATWVNNVVRAPGAMNGVGDDATIRAVPTWSPRCVRTCGLGLRPVR